MNTATPTNEIREQSWADFKERLRRGALRFLHGIDLRVDSPTYGICDRDYWAWKTKDFANGTLQGGIAGFLDSVSLLEISSAEIKEIVDAILIGTQSIQRGNGSFEEAYPLESSYAVTGLVLFNLLYAQARHSAYFDTEAKNRIGLIAERSMKFLKKTPETHGVISNHLMTTLAALCLYAAFREEKNEDAFKQVQSLIDSQHEEGWFTEYSGADPGYQSLLNHYWIALAELVGSEADKWSEALAASYEFVGNFVLPAGYFGGETGARGTSILYPSGLISCFSREHSINWFFDEHISCDEAVGPTEVDSGNFVPVFNSWGYLFGHWDRGSQLSQDAATNASYSEAELLVWRTKTAHLVLNTQNGAYRLMRKSGSGWRDESIVSFKCSQGLTQLGQATVVTRDEHRVELRLSADHPKYVLNTGTRAILVRAAGFVTAAFPVLQRLLKKALARIIMTESSHAEDVGITLHFELKDTDIEVQINNPSAHQALQKGYYRHMASANTYRSVPMPDDVNEG